MSIGTCMSCGALGHAVLNGNHVFPTVTMTRSRVTDIYVLLPLLICICIDHIPYQHDVNKSCTLIYELHVQFLTANKYRQVRILLICVKTHKFIVTNIKKLHFVP